MLRKVGTLLPDCTVLKLNGAEMKAAGTSVKQSILTKVRKYRFFSLLLDTPARRSASVVSYAACQGGLTVNDGRYTNDHTDNYP